MLCPIWASAGAGLVFDGCTVLNSGSPWHDYVMYVFSARAGVNMVNDLHVCVYDAAGNLIPVAGVSTPPSWQGHVPMGGECIHYWTLDRPIQPGETYGPFDFVVPPGNCHITIVWWFTYNDVPVTDPVTEHWTCAATGIEPSTWGAVKALYR
jgi:hypothetical protein